MKYLAALLLATLAVISVPAASQAEICGEATTFNIQAYRPNGSVVSEQNKAGRNEVLMFTWQICPDATVTDNFGNSHYGDYQFNRGISDQPPNWFDWVVSSQGDSRTKRIYINDPVTPPPPPAELTCCAQFNTNALQQTGISISDQEARDNGVLLPLNFNTGINATHKCWRNHGPDALQPNKKPEFRSQGVWPFNRKVTLRAYWCSIKGVKITGSSLTVDPSVSGGGQCSVTGTSKYIVQGGVGQHAVVWQGKALFKCIVFVNLPLIPFDELNLDQWAQGVYYDQGGHFQVKSGGS
jgi:hypothetical protein